ncbi:MAG: UvrD-helicase domain-containing protein [Candidatus Polarisedimenticolia bacterium]|nr:UvrD-helicase domain-containing protein [bacterium]
MLDTERMLAGLNPPQRQAVLHGEGPLLILAGAGSGKTRVITCRVAHLVGTRGVDPRSIVALTFTNKAAAEMRERAEQLLGHALGGAYLGTFHSFGLRLLRANAVAAGLQPDFVVYDTADQQAIVRKAMKEVGLEESGTTPRKILSIISSYKNGLVDVDEAEGAAKFPNERMDAACYRIYEEALRRAGALDFDDLLVRPARLFAARPEILERYARRIEWLLVDEYQDTNPLQYRIVRQLTTLRRNLCCVGDEDQSIYAFRGADIRNILDFGRDFPEATIVKLEQNYRSTGNILAAASAVIGHNKRRHAKTLWTSGSQGAKVRVHTASNDREEADFVVGRMQELAREEGTPLDQMAVLYRTNSLSRLLEDRLLARRVAYRVVGSLRFYDRKEIKDLLAWLRLVVHPGSDQDFLRAAQTPPRGIGEKTLEELGERAKAKGIPLHDAAVEAAADEAVPQRTRKALDAFLGTIHDLADLSKTISTVASVQSAIDALDYLEYLRKAHPNDHDGREENIGSFLAAAREHDEGGAPDGMAGFLDRVSLRSDTDDVQGERGGVSLMTVHSAKGLEFDVVFVVGLNEDLFPHLLSADDPEAIEEERRLLYVAMTRARKRLTLTLARERRPFGKPTAAQPSRFLDELPEEIVHATESAAAAWAGPAPRANGYGAPPFFGATARPSFPAAPPTRPAGVAAPRGERVVERDGEAPEFRPGVRVRHPMFGAGMVMSAEGAGRSLRLTIRFDRAGMKKIMAAATALTIED